MIKIRAGDNHAVIDDHQAMKNIVRTCQTFAAWNLPGKLFKEPVEAGPRGYRDLQFGRITRFG